MTARPRFVIIGAAKCATSTLYQQLVAQPGIFMCTPKEPNFFSNDEEYARGIDWYWNLFEPAAPGDLCGEASTHYTKLPTYPHTVERLKEHLPDARLIYMMRHPIDRLVSQYIHEWTELVVSEDIDTALDRRPELIAYSRYSMQLQPFFDAFGSDRVLPVFFDRFCQAPQEELARVCAFIGYEGEPVWQADRERDNVSKDRMRKSAWRDLLVNAPVLSTLRRTLVPQGVRDWIKGFWRMKERPQLSPESEARLRETFDADLAVLGSWLGMDLNCENFKAVARDRPAVWTNPPDRQGAIAD